MLYINIVVLCNITVASSGNNPLVLENKVLKESVATRCCNCVVAKTVKYKTFMNLTE